MLHCKDNDIIPEAGHPFSEDKLNREPIAQMLTRLIDNLSHSGAVIALDGEWGVGKTTFVRMWKQSLVDSEYRTLYFNAWESDYIDDPLIALLGELKDVVGDNSRFKSLAANGGKVALRFGAEIVKGVVQKYIGVDSDAIKATIDETANVFSNQVDQYKEQKLELQEFKTKLSEYVAFESNDKPIVFFIDELDRCNPFFAVKLLERIKHLFEVPNIIFVLAVNINQLQFAIQGYFGSSNLNGREYIKRFVDFEFRLPVPDIEKYLDFICEKNDFDSYFKSSGRNSFYDVEDKPETFRSIAKDLIACSRMNFRSVNRLISLFRIAISTFPANSYIHIDLVFLLCYLKFENPKIYINITEGNYKIQELIDEIEEALPASIFESKDYNMSDRHIAFAIASLLLCYNYSSRMIEREADFKGTPKEGSRFDTYPIKTKRLKKELLEEALYYRRNGARGYYQDGLTMITSRIDLLQAYGR